MTEAEELEMLELEEQEARSQPEQAPAVPPQKPGSRRPGAVESGMLGFGQGLTFGFGDELGAGLQAGLQKTANALPKGWTEWAGIENKYGPQDAGAVYKQARTENRELLEHAEEDNPWAYNIGNVVGGAVVPLPGGAAAGAGRTALGVGGKLIGKQALNALEKEALKLVMKEAAKKGAFAGAKTGAAFGLGSSKADFTEGDYGGLARDAAIGGTLGAALGGTLGAGSQWASERVVSPGIKVVGDYAKKQAAKRSAGKLQEKLEQHAQDRAIKAMAGSGHLKTLRELEHKGIAKQVAKDSADQGVLRNASADDMYATATERAQHFGNKLQQMIAEGDAKARPLVSGPELVKRAQAEIVDPLMRGNAGDQAVAKRLLAEMETLSGKGDMGFAETSLYKNSFDKYLKHGAEQPPYQEALKKLQGLVVRDMDDKLDAIGQSLKSGLGTRFRKTKKLYGSMREAEKMLEERSLQLRNNRTLSLTDMMSGIGAGGAGLSGALASGNIEAGIAALPAALATAGISKFSRERGPQVYALALRKLADAKAADPRTTWKLLSKTLAKANTAPPVLPKVAGRSARLLPEEAAEAARPLYAQTEEDRLKELQELMLADR